MPSCTICSLCDNPGTFQDSVEKGQVPCDVRHFAGERFTVWRCVNCNSVHSADDVDLARYYSQYPLQKQKLEYPLRIAYRRRLQLLDKHGVRRSARILDYGCGTGVFVQFLRENGFTSVYGYDPFVPAYADRKVLNEQYDAVVSFDVIEHVDDPRQLLAELRNLLHPLGHLVIGTPNANYLSVRAETSPDIELSQPFHRHILSEQALLDLAHRSRLRTVQVYRTNLVDSMIPGINTRFMWTYIKRTGGAIDVAVEPPRLKVILSSPRLLFYAFFGALFPPRGNMVGVFEGQ